MKIHPRVLLSLLLLLGACSSGLDRQLDGRNQAAFADSLAGMKKTAKAAETARLDRALLMLAIADVDIGYEGGILGALDKLSANKTPEELAEALMPQVDGRTGREVIAAGEKRAKAEAGRQLARLNPELTQLQNAQAARAGVKPVLDAITVLEPSLRFSGTPLQRSSIMEFRIVNGSNLPLSYLYLRGTVSAPPGDKILFADDINYKLSEALPPGETKLLRLPNTAPDKWNAAGIWGRGDLAFTVEVFNVETQPGRKLAASFGFKDAQRLALLEKDKPRLEKMLAD